MKYTGISEIGLYRKDNQDRIAVIEREHALLAILCDGIGGANAGSIASQMCVTMLKEAFEQSSDIEDSDRAIAWFGKVIKDINKAIYHESLVVSDYHGMGTTLVVCIVFADTWVAFNIGDSRLYRYHDQTLHQLTHDQTYAYELYLRDEIKLDDVDKHPKRNILMNAVGIDEHISFETIRREDQPWDFLLLSSDGLHGYVDFAHIENALKEKDILKIREKLLALAYEAGAYDNISVLLIEGDRDE